MNLTPFLLLFIQVLDDPSDDNLYLGMNLLIILFTTYFLCDIRACLLPFGDEPYFNLLG